jgi:hypothetical protein
MGTGSTHSRQPEHSRLQFKNKLLAHKYSSLQVEEAVGMERAAAVARVVSYMFQVRRYQLEVIL